MSRKAKSAGVDPAVAAITIPAALLDELVKGPMEAAEVQAASMAFKKALIERAMGAELSHHLGYRDGEPRPEGQANHRNGHTGKTVLTDDGPVRITVPRDRDGDFEPILIPKHARRFTGVVFHSDRGSQYASAAHRSELAAHGMLASMSGKGDCYDNAVAESFFATLEFELVMTHDWHTRDEARRAIFRYIETWYNWKRRHSTLGYVSPAEYEAQVLQAA